MKKREELKEIIKAEILKAHKKGKLKEDWVSNWINQIFDKTTKRRLKNDPELKRLYAELESDVEDYFKLMIKKYKSAENFPLHVKHTLGDAGYPGF
tara:strand:- start:97 stop:384 length:288 start_codon:yes stop_codon:yes gene_type:complete